jgi:transcriptional regulator GlxA family with amidase domain
MQNVAIFLFDDVEVLDFAGPFEIFSVTGLRNKGQEKPFNVFTIAEKKDIKARNNLLITANFTFEDAPKIDILLIPGGGGFHENGKPFGSRKEMHNEVLLNWINAQYSQIDLLLSVCTGSLILAKAGLLEGLKATTHWKAETQMLEVAPNTTLFMQERWVDNGKIILSAGVSAGIDMSLYVVSKLLGKEAALETAQYIHYDYWN